jgi:hypothetical protein
MENHIPRAHTREISVDDFLFQILYTSGKLKRGIITLAAIPANTIRSLKYSGIYLPL